MYSRTNASSRPTVDTKYPRAQKLCPTGIGDFNRYEYAMDRPTIWWDAYGLDPGDSSPGDSGGGSGGSGSGSSGTGGSGGSTPPSPTPCTKCGPDITNALRVLETDLTKFVDDDLDWLSRFFVCQLSTSSSWDIYELHNHLVKNPNCPINCDHSVEMFGVCVDDGDANYFMWGVMARLCGYYSEDSEEAVYFYKANLPVEGYGVNAYLAAIWAERSGYSSGKAVGSPNKKCPTGCGPWNGRFTWNWGNQGTSAYLTQQGYYASKPRPLP